MSTDDEVAINRSRCLQWAAGSWRLHGLREGQGDGDTVNRQRAHHCVCVCSGTCAADVAGPTRTRGSGKGLQRLVCSAFDAREAEVDTFDANTEFLRQPTTAALWEAQLVRADA